MLYGLFVRRVPPKNHDEWVNVRERFPMSCPGLSIMWAIAWTAILGISASIAPSKVWIIVRFPLFIGMLVTLCACRNKYIHDKNMQKWKENQRVDGRNL